MTTPTISVIIPSVNRPTLDRAIRSARWADEIVVVFDAAEPPRHPAGCVVRATGPDGVWGGPQRNLGMQIATGTHFAFMDDDDVYTRDAGAAIRAAVTAEPRRAHIFRQRNRDRIYAGPIVSGEIGTKMFIAPREPIGVWTSRYSGDFDFILDTMTRRGDEPVYHQAIIASVRPPTLRRWFEAMVDPAIQKRVAGRTLRRLRRKA